MFGVGLRRQRQIVMRLRVRVSCKIRGWEDEKNDGAEVTKIMAISEDRVGSGQVSS